VATSSAIGAGTGPFSGKRGELRRFVVGFRRRPSVRRQQNDHIPRIHPPGVCLAVEPFESVAIVVERPRNRPPRTRAGRVGAV
jgi:hypothetical protein